MRIVIPLELLPAVFPNASSADREPDRLREELRDFYSYGSIEPNVEIGDDRVTIDVDTSSIEDFDRRYEEATSLAEGGQMAEAESRFEALIDDHPGVSELHRMYAQTIFEQDRGEEALDAVIDALRWNPENVHALTLAGNIFVQTRDDVETAKTYYNRAAEIAPENHLVLNNLGGTLLKAGQVEEGRRFLQKALDAKSDYPNTHYGLALSCKREGELREAFEHATDGLKCAGRRAPIRQHLENIASDIAEAYDESADLSDLIEDYASELEDRGGKKVETIARSDIDTPAKLEVAENYGRDVHRVIYQPSKSFVAHLVMHEMAHLDLIFDARNAGENELVVSSEAERQKFIEDSRSSIQKLQEQGLDRKQIDGFVDRLFNGLNNQVYNGPIDLFIENRLYEKYPDLRPVQFGSIESMMEENIKGATDPEMKELAPRKVRAANIVLNLTHAFQLRDLYGMDRILEFDAPRALRNRAKKFYDEFLDIKGDRRPSEEYDLIHFWSQDLDVDDYFRLVNEEEHRSRRNESSQSTDGSGDTDVEETGEVQPDDEGDESNSSRLRFESTHGEEQGSKSAQEVMGEIEEDPHNLNDPNRPDEEEGPQISFKGEAAGSMAVTMHLVDAIQTFKSMSDEEIQQVTFEIAMLGNQGLDPYETDKRYSLNSMHDREFSPLQLLAYMFAGFKRIDESVDTQLDFEDEYQQARKMAGLDS